MGASLPLGIHHPSVIVDDFDVVSLAIAPAEANPPLIVYADAMLALSVACQFLESIAAGHSQVPEGCCGVEDKQPAQRRPLQFAVEFCLAYSIENSRCFPVPKAPDHGAPRVRPYWAGFLVSNRLDL